jgi:hypothetical protein
MGILENNDDILWNNMGIVVNFVGKVLSIKKALQDFSCRALL